MNKINVLFCGDFSPVGRYEGLVESDVNIFGDLCEDIVSSDVAFLNLEAPICVDGFPIKKSGPSLRINPKAAAMIAGAGFDVVGLANNHVMDYGESGLLFTIENCRQQGLRFCGAGSNLRSAQEVCIVERKGVKIAIIAVAEHEFSIANEYSPGAAPLDPIDNIAQIEQAKLSADIVFITVHGGNEYFKYPRPGLRKICRFYIERGADGVICHHPHVPGAYEIHNGKPIIYSLGNLIFDTKNPKPQWDEGYSVRFSYDVGEGVVSFSGIEFIPYLQSFESKGITKMQGERLGGFLNELDSMRSVLEDDLAWKREWSHYCERRKPNILAMQYFPFRIRGISKLSKIFPIANIFLPKSMISERLNLVRCESHRELLVSILENT